MKTQIPLIKSLVFVLVCFQGLIAQANTIPSINIESARLSASKENKLLMLKFGAAWCLPCKFMDKTVFSDQELLAYMQTRVVMVQVDIDQFSGRDLKELYQIKTVPTILFVHPNGKELARKENSMGISDFKNWLESLVVENNITVAESTLPADASSRIVVEQKEEDFFQDMDKNKIVNQAPVKEVEAPISILSQDSNFNKSEVDSKEDTIDISNFQEKNSILFGQFYVQLGAFTMLENAVSKANDLDEKFSQNASISEIEDRNGNVLFKINLGPFDSEEEAELFVEVLKDRQMEALVIKAEL